MEDGTVFKERRKFLYDIVLISNNIKKVINGVLIIFYIV